MPKSDILFIIKISSAKLCFKFCFFEIIFEKSWKKCLESLAKNRVGQVTGTIHIFYLGLIYNSYYSVLQGTDTVAALSLLRKFYHCPMAGFSIPASEHSTITTWGQQGESDACRNMLESFPEGTLNFIPTWPFLLSYWLAIFIFLQTLKKILWPKT